MSLSGEGLAFGTAYIDDGISFPPGPSSTLTMRATDGEVSITRGGSFDIDQRLGMVTVLGVVREPTHVQVNGAISTSWEYLAPQDELVVRNMTADLNNHVTLSWT